MTSCVGAMSPSTGLVIDPENGGSCGHPADPARELAG